MNNTLQKTSTIEALNLLLIGNNPIEMGALLDKVNRLRSTKIVTEIAFDLKTITERLAHFKPNYILIDDNIGKLELTQIVATFCSNNRTKNIPMTVLKNSNYHESFISFCNLDYVLKQGWNAESLFISLKNSLKFKRTQLFFVNTYNNRKRPLLKLSK
jgi:hypothetical protein